MPAWRILLVEDDDEVGQLLDVVLRSEGYAVDYARDAAQARKRMAADRYDLVLTDWRLPDGDGVDIADLAADAGVKTILMSGYLLQVPADRIAGCGLLMKPIRPRELVEAIERVLGAAVGS
jgi:DNA-binding response OmpR family regulator